jgi:molybdopterin molybdotransferase
MEFQRGNLSQNEKGDFWVTSAGGQGSHQLGSMSRSNCYIILPADCRGVATGEQVIVEPFDAGI